METLKRSEPPSTSSGSALTASPPGWSDDGNWFWDGLRWNDGLSPDGKWRFDGAAWQLFHGQRSSMPTEPLHPAVPEPPPSAPSAPAVGLPSWVDQSEVDRLEQERREGENRDAHVALPQVPLPPAFERWLVIRKVLLWAGLVVGVGILLFGLLGIISLSVSGTARSGSVAVAVVFAVFGGAVSVACVVRLLGFAISLGPVGTAISSLGILGCLVLLGTVVNTYASVTSQTGGGRYVIPWATVLVVVRRAWKGRWLGAVILSVAWVVAVLITLAVHPIAP